MAISSRSQVVAVKKETTEGTLEALTAGSEFIKVRAGTELTSENEIVESDELVNSIGKSAPIVVGENPSGSIPLYIKHSGVEGQEPEAGILLESAMGSVTANGTEYDTVAASTVSIVKVDSGEGANFVEGQALLVKDATNGYSIRNIDSISSDDLTLGFDLASAPAVGINLGKAVQYIPASSGHPTYSVYRYASETSAGYRDAMAGCRSTSLTFDLNARELASLSAEFEGISYYWNQIVIDATNDDFSVTDDGGAFTGSVEQKAYKTPIEFADELETKLNAAGDDVFTVTYSNTTGKFTVASDGAVLQLTCSAANSVFAEIGFGAIDLTGATTYTAATALSFDAPYTPAYDDIDPIVVVDSELLIGDSDDYICRKASAASFAIGTPKTQVLSVCAENGVVETIINERSVTLSATILLSAYEAELFDRSFNNTTSKIAFSTGPKDNAGNYIAGKCFNIFMQSAKIDGITTADQDGYRVINLTATGFVGGSTQDVFLNYV